jgi:hypothetical protein
VWAKRGKKAVRRLKGARGMWAVRGVSGCGL